MVICQIEDSPHVAKLTVSIFMKGLRTWVAMYRQAILDLCFRIYSEVVLLNF